MPELFNVSSWLLDRYVDAGRGDRVAVQAGDRSLTYSDVLSEVCAAAAALTELGVRPEERVVLVLRDTVAFVAAFLGAARIGAIPVPTNPLLPARDLAAIARLSLARALLTHDHDAEHRAELTAGAPDLEQVVHVPLGSETAASVDGLSWPELLDPASDAPPYSTWTDSPGFWLCTSGTTGEPKLVMHRHADVRVTAETYARRILEVGECDR